MVTKIIQGKGKRILVMAFVLIHLCLNTGDSEEPLSIYFSAPESLQYHIFSAFSDAWAVAATSYSILLYGGQTYFELRYLPVSRFIGEVSRFHRGSEKNLFYPLRDVFLMPERVKGMKGH